MKLWREWPDSPHAPLQVPNGELSAKQLRFLGDQIAPLAGGCGDITTRANVQLRGMTLAEADKIFEARGAPGLPCTPL